MDGSNSEVKVTEEMMVAGVEEYSLFDSGDPGEWTVCAVYRAMEKARRLGEAKSVLLDGDKEGSRFLRQP